MGFIEIFINFLNKIGLIRSLKNILHDILSIVLGIISGFLGSLFEYLTSGTARGAVIGGFMSLGVVVIRHCAQEDMSLKRFPSIWKILPIASIVGIIAGLAGYYTVFVNIKSTISDLGMTIPTFRFSLQMFILLSISYPLLLIPIHFIGNTTGLRVSLCLSLFAGVCASISVEYFYLHSFSEAFFSSFIKGLPFAAIWITFMHFSESSFMPFKKRLDINPPGSEKL